MADLEKVIEKTIKGLEFHHRKQISKVKCPENCCGCPYDAPNECLIALITDALELLKEQDRLLRKKQKEIDKLCAEYSNITHRFHEKTEIVRCKDCKKNGTWDCPLFTDAVEMKMDDNWFCKDGERT